MLAVTRKRFTFLFGAFVILILIFFSLKNQSSTLSGADPFIKVEYVDEQSIDLNDPKHTLDVNYILKPFVHMQCNDLLGILIITSYVGHDSLRSAHRQAMPSHQLRSIRFERIFLLAQIPPHEKYITQKAVIDENNRFEDLLQGDFLEAYRNLSIKHIMGLKWAATECQKVKFIIKIDDDTVFDIYHLKYFLENTQIEAQTPYLTGFILDDKKPIRLKANKWYVTEQEYDRDSYPDYLSGWLYITNPSTAKQLVHQSQYQKFFWIDDTWITGILRDKLNIPLTRLNDWFSANSQFLDCCIEDVKRLRLKCDYYVGPNGGDENMIVKYSQTISKCYLNAAYCFRRPSDKLLNRTCIGQMKNIIGQHGEAIINAIKL